MPQTTNRQGHDYATPPALISALAHGTTWALWCKQCRREVVVDVIGLLERHDPYDRISFARAKCKACGAILTQTVGYVLRSLQHRGRMPRLVTTDGSSFRMLTISHTAGVSKVPPFAKIIVFRRLSFSVWRSLGAPIPP